jgi:Icc-related predicted phosphoesterase
MRIDLISDLHLDFGDLVLPGGDILIIAGDLCEAKNFKKELYNPKLRPLPTHKIDRRADRCYRFIKEECSEKYRETIYVFGNHEHYKFQIHKTYEHFKNQLPSNVHLLENESFDIEDVTFVGATLWTDMNKSDPLTLFHTKQGMSDFNLITMLNESNGCYHKLTPEYTTFLHKRSFEYIKAVVETDPNHKYVVVTHHAPSPLSIHPIYERDSLMNGAYQSNLSEYIMDHSQIKVWAHGHTHHAFDYDLGATRILCNPRGYLGYENSANYFEVKSFEV